jgi:hypothetical protein
LPNPFLSSLHLIGHHPHRSWLININNGSVNIQHIAILLLSSRTTLIFMVKIGAGWVLGPKPSDIASAIEEFPAPRLCPPHHLVSSFIPSPLYPYIQPFPNSFLFSLNLIGSHPHRTWLMFGLNNVGQHSTQCNPATFFGIDANLHGVNRCWPGLRTQYHLSRMWPAALRPAFSTSSVPSFCSFCSIGWMDDF